MKSAPLRLTHTLFIHCVFTKPGQTRGQTPPTVKSSPRNGGGCFEWAGSVSLSRTHCSCWRREVMHRVARCSARTGGVGCRGECEQASTVPTDFMKFHAPHRHDRFYAEFHEILAWANFSAFEISDVSLFHVSSASFNARHPANCPECAPLKLETGFSPLATWLAATSTRHSALNHALNIHFPLRHVNQPRPKTKLDLVTPNS